MRRICPASRVALCPGPCTQSSTQVSDTQPHRSVTAQPHTATQVSDTQPQTATQVSDTQPQTAMQVSATQPHRSVTEPHWSLTQPHTATQVSDRHTGQWHTATDSNAGQWHTGQWHTAPQVSDSTAQQVSDTTASKQHRSISDSHSQQHRLVTAQPQSATQVNDRQPQSATQVGDSTATVSNTGQWQTATVSNTGQWQHSHSQQYRSVTDSHSQPHRSVTDSHNQQHRSVTARGQRCTKVQRAMRPEMYQSVRHEARDVQKCRETSHEARDVPKCERHECWEAWGRIGLAFPSPWCWSPCGTVNSPFFELDLQQLDVCITYIVNIPPEKSLTDSFHPNYWRPGYEAGHTTSYNTVRRSKWDTDVSQSWSSSKFIHFQFLQSVHFQCLSAFSVCPLCLIQCSSTFSVCPLCPVEWMSTFSVCPPQEASFRPALIKLKDQQQKTTNQTEKKGETKKEKTQKDSKQQGKKDWRE